MTNRGGDDILFVTDMTYIYKMSYPSLKIVTEITVTDMTARNVIQS